MGVNIPLVIADKPGFLVLAPGRVSSKGELAIYVPGHHNIECVERSLGSAFGGTIGLRCQQCFTTMTKFYVQDRFPETPKWLRYHAPEHLLIFTHIEKAAGTSFTNFLGQVYGRHLGLRYGDWGTPIVQTPLEEMTATTAHELYAFASHDRWGVHNRFGAAATPDVRSEIARKNIIYVTIVRDPLERFYSGYRYIQSAELNPRHKLVKTLSFADFVRLELAAAPGRKTLNLMCEMVTGKPNVCFEQAAESLEQNYALAAPVSKSIELINEMGILLGWPETAEYSIQNKTEVKPKATTKEMEDARNTGLFEEDIRLFEFIDRAGLLKGRASSK